MPSQHEYVAFVAKDADALERLRLLIAAVQDAKQSKEARDRLVATAARHMTEEDLARFWWPTPEDSAEAMEDWWATPVESRFGSPHLRTQWRLDAALTVTVDCDYLVSDIVQVGDLYHVRFLTYGYPYGGTESLVTLVQGLGHRVTGVDDGTGYRDYVPVERLWKPKRLRSA